MDSIRLLALLDCKNWLFFNLAYATGQTPLSSTHYISLLLTLKVPESASIEIPPFKPHFVQFSKTVLSHRLLMSYEQMPYRPVKTEMIL